MPTLHVGLVSGSHFLAVRPLALCVTRAVRYPRCALPALRDQPLHTTARRLANKG